MYAEKCEMPGAHPQKRERRSPIPLTVRVAQREWQENRIWRGVAEGRREVSEVEEAEEIKETKESREGARAPNKGR